MSVIFSHAIAAAAFAGLALWLLVRAERSPFDRLLAAAGLIQSLWLGLSVAITYDVSAPRFYFPELEAVRTAAWTGVMLAALRAVVPEPSWRRAAWGAVAVAVIGIPVAGFIDRLPPVLPQGDLEMLSWTGFLLLSLLGLVLTENLFRNCRPERRWAVKYLCFGVGGLFAYDLYLYADALLFRGVSVSLVEARGMVSLLVVPLIAVSATRKPWRTSEMAVSRRAVFHTAAIVGTGLYLIAMSAAGYYLREVGGTWGGLLQTTFLAGSLTLLFVVLFSGTAQSWLRRIISRHFFRDKYDYRDEWLRFTTTIGAGDAGIPLGHRVIEALASLVDSPGGAAWVHRPDSGGFVLTDRWNFAPKGGGDIPDTHPFAERLHRLDRVLDLDEIRRQDRPPEDLPGWLLHSREAWLLAPLIHHRGVFGMIVLQQPRVGRELDGEDQDLLITAGRQAAAYLSERDATESLEAARRMEEFNRRFAFVIHDLKNMVSQLSLILSNAKEHGDNPAFQADVLATVQSAVDRMTRLLVQMHRKKGENAAGQIAVDGLLRRLAQQVLPAKVRVLADEIEPGLVVHADEERLANAVSLLLRNAAEAAGDGGTLHLRARRTTDGIEIDVEDDGPGMEPEFVQTQLFSPLRSTKSEGYGIGAYQSRELIRELGGRLDVVSVPGSGTTMTIHLPYAPAASGEPRRVIGK